MKIEKKNEKKRKIFDPTFPLNLKNFPPPHDPFIERPRGAKKAPRGPKNGQIGKNKFLPLDIPIMMLNHQKNWIEVNLGAPQPGMTIFSIFQPQKSP